MILWDRVKKSFDSGTDVIKRTAVVVSERARIETAVAKLLIERGSAETRLAKMSQELGERVFQLWEQGSENVMSDHLVLATLREMDTLNDNIEELNQKVRSASLGEGA